MKPECKTVTLQKNFYLLNNANDIEDILTEFQNCLPELATSAEYRRNMADKFAKHAFFLLYKDNNHNQGFSAFYSNDDNLKTAYISFIAVAEDYRGNRIGSLLLNQVINIALQNNMTYIKLEVKKSNTAHDFYKKNGFKYWGEASENSIYMIRRIG